MAKSSSTFFIFQARSCRRHVKIGPGWSHGERGARAYGSLRAKPSFAFG